MGLIDKIKNYLNEEEPEEIAALEDQSNQEVEAARAVDNDESENEFVDEEKTNRLKEKKGLLGGLFRKKSKKADMTALKEAVNNAPKKSRLSDIDPGLINSIQGSGSSSDERKAATDFCEQLVDITYHMEDMKREYQIVTSYLMDIQRIEELPVDMANDLNENARRIEMVNDNKNIYVKSEKLLSQEQYNTMATLEKDVPDTIVKLIDMEQRDGLLKNDMSYLEGEKEDLRFLHSEYIDTISRIRGITVAVLVVFLMAVMMMLIFAMGTKNSVTVPCLFVGLVAALFFTVSYVKYINLQSELRENDAKLKRAISVLNKVKVKFINNTNTLDYIYSKYGVNSSNELEFIWDQYNQMVRDALRYSQANNDLRVYCDDLISKLKSYGLSDPYVWPKQTRALIDRREMVEIKHGLNVRRQKIRENLETCDKIKTNARVALRAAIDANPGLESYIRDQLSSYNIKLGND